MEEKVSIIGCGTMGHSIALAAACSGINVKVYGVDEKDIKKANIEVGKKVNIMVENDLFSKSEAQLILKRIYFGTDIQEVIQRATYIIEAVPEVIETKYDLYKDLEQLIEDKVIIASNTSGFTPTQLAEGVTNPSRLIVTHFWNPGHLIPLVEVVKGEETSKETVDRSIKLMKDMNKQPILIQKDIPGFIGNRLQYALFREAQALLDQGVATKEDIDAAVTYSIGRRLPVTGPLITADMGGLDVFSSISNYLFEDLSSADKSGEILSKLVKEKKFGDKSGEGFYIWDEETSRRVNDEREQILINFLKLDQVNKERE